MIGLSKEKVVGINFFEKYLTIWVTICMIIGIVIGKYIPIIPEVLGKLEYAHTSIPIAILIWIMIYPMMMKIDFQSVKNVGKNPAGVCLSCGISWLVKPVLMFGLASLFFYVIFSNFISADLAQHYVVGAVLLGAAPCTAMVFIWSNLTKGNPAYTLVQVTANDLLILVLFAPIVTLLLGISNISIPWDVLIFSIIIFVVIPLVAGIITRVSVIEKKGEEYFNEKFVTKFDSITTVGLLLTLIIIFSFQGNVILSNPFHILLIAVPLILQNLITFALAYFSAWKMKLPHDIAAPAGLIGASDFFELSVAVAITLFGASSPVVLVTVVGVLTEVPVMLVLVKIVNKTRKYFPTERLSN